MQSYLPDFSFIKKSPCPYKGGDQLGFPINHDGYKQMVDSCSCHLLQGRAQRLPGMTGADRFLLKTSRNDLLREGGAVDGVLN